ncbi:MAG: class I SAM-dependent methyltransferase [Bacteroidota bacterium]
MPLDTNRFKAIIDYYDKTRFDYNVAWDSSEFPAVHFGFYDENADKHSDALQNTNQVLANLARVKAGDYVLDAGCGRGGSCFWLAQNRRAKTIGITPVQSQIDECRQNAIDRKLEAQCQFELADYCHTPFKDEQFDVIWACESLCHADQKRDFYQEAFRLLRPGGRLVMAEYMRRHRPLSDDDERLLMSWLNGWAIKDIDSRSEHLQHAQAVGFTAVDIQDVTSAVRTSLRNLHRNSTNWLWFSHLLRLLRLRTTTQHINQRASIHQYEALERGSWTYNTLTAQKP